VSINQAGVEQTLDFTLLPPQFSSLSSPLDISGCRLWLRADSITGLEDDSPVDSWPDGSESGNHATQDTPGDRPVYKPNIINANPGVRFDGANDFLELTLAEACTDHTFFFVYDHTPGGGGNNCLFDAQQGRLALNATARGASPMVQWDAGNEHEIAPAIPGWQILTWVFSGTGGEVFRNGSRLGAGSYDPKPIGGNVSLGANYRGSASSFRGDIAEALYYNRALPAVQREQIERYLSNRYSIPID
jgi:trimeric autotransporter adhesin